MIPLNKDSGSQDDYLWVKSHVDAQASVYLLSIHTVFQLSTWSRIFTQSPQLLKPRYSSKENSWLLQLPTALKVDDLNSLTTFFFFLK